MECFAGAALARTPPLARARHQGGARTTVLRLRRGCALARPLTQARQGAGDGEVPADETPGAKRRWYEEQQKRKEEELARLGLRPDQAYR